MPSRNLAAFVVHHIPLLGYDAEERQRRGWEICESVMALLNLKRASPPPATRLVKGSCPKAHTHTAIEQGVDEHDQGGSS
jgi:hypothetical protein